MLDVWFYTDKDAAAPPLSFKKMSVVPSVGHTVRYFAERYKVTEVCWDLLDPERVEVYLELAM